MKSEIVTSCLVAEWERRDARYDVDVAFYARADKTPSAEPDLLNWLAERRARVEVSLPEQENRASYRIGTFVVFATAA